MNKKELCIYVGISYAIEEKYIFSVLLTIHEIWQNVKFDK